MKKQSLVIAGSINLVEKLDTSLRNELSGYKIKGTSNAYKLSISSTQAEARKAQIESVALKQLHAGQKILQGYVKQGLVKLKAAKDEKTLKTLVKELEKQIETVNKRTAKTYQDVMNEMWKKIAKAEADAEKAVELAEKIKKDEAKKQPKLSKTDWFKLVLKGLAMKKTLSKGFGEFQNLRKSAVLSAATFDQEMLRVEAEVSRTPPEVISQQRQILANGHAKQLGKDLGAVAASAKKLLGNVEGILGIAKKIDEDAAKAHAEVRKLQSELSEAEKTIVKLKPLLGLIDSQKGVILGKATDIALGKVPAKQKLETDLESQMNLDQDFGKLFSHLDGATSAATSVAKM